MSGRRRLMMVMPEDCLTFDVIAAEGQTVKFAGRPAVYGQNWSVDWGDGSFDEGTGSTGANTTFTHAYSAGFYRIKVRAGTGGVDNVILSGSTANICACKEGLRNSEGICLSLCQRP